MALIDQAVSEKKIFENGGRRRTTTDGRTPGACLSEKNCILHGRVFVMNISKVIARASTNMRTRPGKSFKRIHRDQ